MNDRLFNAIVMDRKAFHLFHTVLMKEINTFLNDEGIPASSRVLNWPQHHELVIRAMDYVTAEMPDLAREVEARDSGSPANPLRDANNQ